MKNSHYRDYLVHTAPTFLHGILTGGCVGILIFFFRLAAEELTHLSQAIYQAVRGNLIYTVLLFAGLVLFALLMALLHKFAPSAKGGGIPRSEGILRGSLDLRAVRALVGSVLGSFISFVCGLPLGSEGPSVLAGTATGHLTGYAARDRAAKDRYLMTGGACAGFAVATGSPLSAILFALEEVHKRFTPMLLLVTSASVISATAVNRVLCAAFGISPSLFAIPNLPDLTMKDMGFVVLIALFVSLAVFVFDLAVSHFNRLMRTKLRFVPHACKLITVFVLTGIIGLFAVDALGGGGSIISSLIGEGYALPWLIALLVIRFAMIVLVSSSGATGGIFVPTLAVGALIGGLAARLFTLMGMDPSHTGLIVLIAMSAFMGGTMRAPLTAAVFFVEVTAQYENLFFVATAVFLVYFVTEIFNRTSFYDLLLEDMEEDQNHGKKAEVARFYVRVSHGAFVIGKAVRDILWPRSTIVTGIIREGESALSMDNGGEKKMYEGDTLLVKSEFYDEEDLRRRLISLVGSEHPIEKLPD